MTNVEVTDKLLIEIINSMEGQPSTSAISRELQEKGCSYSGNAVQRRIDANQEISRAVESKWIQYIENVPLNELFKESRAFGVFPEHAQKIAYKRIDSVILDAIKCMQSQPSTLAISRELQEKGCSYSNTTVQRRIDANQEISRAVENKWIQYIENVPLNELFKESHVFSVFPEHAQKIVYKRIDSVILDAIKCMQGQPNVSAISKELQEKGCSYSGNAVQRRINANIDIFVTYYQKLGLTEDQAIALRFEPGKEVSPALEQSIEHRLNNLGVFREALAVLDCRDTLFEGRIPAWTLEISNYPAVLNRANSIANTSARFDHVSVTEILSGGIPYSNGTVPAMILPQVAHHINSEKLGQVLGEVSRALELSGRIVVTIPEHYTLTDSAASQWSESFGLTLRESYIRDTSLPNDIIQNIPDGLRIANKMKGVSHMIVLEKTADMTLSSAVAALPLDTRIKTDSYIDILHRNGTPIEVPDDINPKLIHSLNASLRDASENAFMLVVKEPNRNGTAGQQILYGYNMDQRNPNTLEQDAKGPSPLTLREERLVTAALLGAMRGDGNPLNVIRGRITTISPEYVRKVFAGK